MVDLLPWYQKNVKKQDGRFVAMVPKERQTLNSTKSCLIASFSRGKEILK